MDVNSGDGGFDVVQFVRYLRARWHSVAICCAVAVGFAGAASLILPKRYTATASILIGAPAGLDPRAATSVSPVYLESLRTFERIALSDSLFQRALEQLGIRQLYSGRSVESLKRSVLAVSKPVNTRVIEISATLEDPRKAQQLAQYIAEQTVALVRSLDAQLSDDVAKEAAALFGKATLRMDAARRAAEAGARTAGAEALSADLDNLRELRLRVDEDLARARAELADSASQVASQSTPQSTPQATPQLAPQGGTEWMERQVVASRARMADLEVQSKKLEQAIASGSAQLEGLRVKRDAVDTELKAARSDFESARAKLADIRAAAAFRGERLDVFDPGIVPQRPSFPNTTLNVLAALLLAALASLTYTAFRFGYDRLTAGAREREYSHRFD